MNIYFINRKSTLKGPYDITDSYRNKIIRMGDVCIRETNNACSFLLVVSTINKWTSCKCVETISIMSGIDENTLLFSFDGINKRVGNKALLDTFLLLFKKTSIRDFILNAIDILSYKCDLWDISIYKDIFIISEPQISHCIKKSIKYLNNNSVTTFQKYLSHNANSLFLILHSEGNTLKEIYHAIKNKYPEDFRQALKSFLKDHPHNTIYDNL